jgi:hypothetical protein
MVRSRKISARGLELAFGDQWKLWQNELLWKARIYLVLFEKPWFLSSRNIKAN